MCSARFVRVGLVIGKDIGLEVLWVVTALSTSTNKPTLIIYCRLAENGA